MRWPRAVSRGRPERVTSSPAHRSRSRSAVERSLIALALAAVIVAGCGKRYPRQVEAHGTVLLDGKPLPKVQIDLVPLFGGFGPEVMAAGESDDEGRFTLSSGLGPKVCAGSYKVTVMELPVPPELMKYEAGAAAKIEAYYKALPNRPLPEHYSSTTDTPLELSISAGQSEYQLELVR
jgi:hypothetical protein